MKKSVQFYSNDFKNLFIDINLIGYHEQGESIVVFIKDIANQEVIFSCVVDCYEVDKSNATEKLLIENNIKEIDLFCWTHPHEDHSKGIDKLFKYFGKKTKVIIPSNLKMDSATNEIKKLYERVTMINKNGKTTNGVLMLTTDTKTLYSTTYIDNRKENIDVDITAFTPISRRIINQIGNKEIDYNEFSIMLLLQIADIKILLASDIQKGTIESFKIDNANIQNVNYIKIPHHCSKTSENLLDIVEYDGESTILATTVFRKYDLPDLKLLEKYKKQFNCILCTSEPYIEKQKKTDEYGVATISIDLHNHSYTVKTTGEAIRI